jgi:hypothetical protein
VAPPAHAGIGTTGVSITEDSFFTAHWKGWAVGLNRSWSYSWRIELTPHAGSSAVVEDHSKENFSGATSTTTPSYSTFVDPRVWGPGYRCAEFKLHHGTTNAGPLVDSSYDCSNQPAALGQALIPPSTNSVVAVT